MTIQAFGGRLSARHYQEVVEARSHKARRSFWHDTPEISVEGKPHSPPAGCVAFRKCFATHLPFAKQCICLTPKHWASKLPTCACFGRPLTPHSDNFTASACRSLTYCNANGPWTMRSMSSHTAASLLMLRPRTSRQPWRLRPPSDRLIQHDPANAQLPSRIRRNRPD